MQRQLQARVPGNCKAAEVVELQRYCVWIILAYCHQQIEVQSEECMKEVVTVISKKQAMLFNLDICLLIPFTKKVLWSIRVFYYCYYSLGFLF